MPRIIHEEQVNPPAGTLHYVLLFEPPYSCWARHRQGRACSFSILFFFLNLIQRTDNTFRSDGQSPKHESSYGSVSFNNSFNNRSRWKTFDMKETAPCPLLHKPLSSSFPFRAKKKMSPYHPGQSLALTHRDDPREGSGRV